MKHRFIQVSAGGNYPDSWSFLKCENCGVTITHYYQRETFTEALKREKISVECKKESDENERD